MSILYRKISLFLILSVSALSATAASNVIPTYIPGGALSNLTVYDAYMPLPQLNDAGWWYFVGLLHDQHHHQHSLQVNITQTQIGKKILGIGQIGFTFRNTADKTVYLWNFYPNLKSMVNYPIGSLESTSSLNNNYRIKVQSNPDAQSNSFLYSFSHNTNDPTHIVGQVHASYTLQANGVGEVGVSRNENQFVHYELTMSLQDQRGLMPEGENGFVGTNSAHLKDNVNSWEFAAPDMRITQWTITLTPIGKTTASSPVTHVMTFYSNQSHDRLWFDRQMLYKKAVIGASPDQNDENEILQTLAQEADTREKTPLFDAIKPLYHGTWMAFCLNKKPFNHICGDAVAIWNKNTPTNVMDSDINASGGFMNLFTPDSDSQGYPINVGSTLTEMLSTQSNQKNLPYDIKNDPSSVYQSPISGNQYAQTVYVTLKSGSLFSDALNSYKNKNTNSGYTLKFQAISKQPENILLSNQNGYYEGAARVSLCSGMNSICRPVGTGFMEQMGY